MRRVHRPNTKACMKKQFLRGERLFFFFLNKIKKINNNRDIYTRNPSENNCKDLRTWGAGRIT